ncbi:MAG: cobyrinic acid ac-diamide synthase [Robiginitomaculum sp.]|nr:MAG: cobyrinic acid ac-diamide synthase [Robiginitomaculum sp.]
MIIVFGNRKGGVGKSTSSVNEAVYILNKLSSDVVILDADRQETAAEWVLEREENEINLERVQLVQKYGKIKNTINDLARKYKHVVIDVAGRNSDEMRSAMLIADVIVMPFKPSTSDFKTIPSMIESIEDAREVNPKLRAVAFLNMCNTSVTNRHEVREWREVLEEFGAFEIAPNMYDRKVYRDCLITGEGVIEMNNPQAKEEVAGLHGVIFK